MTSCRRVALILLLTLILPASAPAATYGLVIGIDNYTGDAPRLEGAVNDARDVADALGKSGAREVKLLLDQGAHRDAIMAAWDELLGKAGKGDILIFHYAGHGGQEPEHVKDSEASHNDSTLILAGFTVQGDGTYQRIVDDELGFLFKRASDAGINVLVAIDACHSGTMTRGFGAPSAKPRVRATTYPPIRISDDRLPPFDPAWALIPNDLPNVIYFGAVQDDEQAPEIVIDGRARGALSWALASGLRGAADANHDGVITKEELQAFITETIRMRLEGRQHPSIIPQGFRAFQYRVRTAAAETAPAPGPSPLAIVNPGGVAAGELARSLRDIVLVAPGGGADLTWDVGGRRVLAGADGVVASFGEPTRAFKRDMTSTPAPAPTVPRVDGRDDLAGVQAAIDTWRRAAPTPPPDGVEPLSLAILNVSGAPAAELAGTLRGVRLVDAKSASAPMLTWDVGRRQVFSGLGDLVAEVGTSKPDDDTRAVKRGVTVIAARPPADGRDDLAWFQGVVDAWRLTERIKRLAERSGLRMALKPDDRTHGRGDKITFVIDGHDQTYFTLFNIGADGTINFLYPLATAEVRDPPQIPLGRAYTVPLEVEAPFGADHLVAIASAGLLGGLHKALQALDGKPGAGALEPALLEQLEGQTYRIGVHGSYTAATR